MLEEDEDADMDAGGVAGMVNSLRYFGVEESKARDFVAAVAEPLSTFMEVYGRGGIVEEAHKRQRNLNVEGLDAFDMRTSKPGGQNWDFTKREDRKLCREVIRDKRPTWVIGSPPCTSYSA